MKVKLYVEGLNAWKSRRWITSKKEFDLLYRSFPAIWSKLFI